MNTAIIAGLMLSIAWGMWSHGLVSGLFAWFVATLFSLFGWAIIGPFAIPFYVLWRSRRPKTT